MIEDGLFNPLSDWTSLRYAESAGVTSGQFAVHAGAVMASTDSFELSLTGKGGTRRNARYHDWSGRDRRANHYRNPKYRGT